MLSVTSCSPNLTEGEVVERHYEPAHTWLMPQTHCYPTGSGTNYSSNCTTIFVPIYEADKWTITVKDCRGHDKCVKDTWRVPESLYNTVTMGQFIHKPE